MDSKFYSIDVFDTVITRTVIDPADIFPLAGEILLQQGVVQTSPLDFAKARGEAYKQAQAETPRTEPTLELIYQKLRGLLRLTHEQAMVALQAELECERQNIVPLPGCRQMVDRIRQSGATVVFLSDMYLPSSFLREQLTRFGLIEATDRVFVSCEVGASKSSGELYKRLRDMVGSRRTQHWTHVGDNLHGDIRMAERAGIETVYLLENGVTRYERMCRETNSCVPLSRSRLAAAMRLARLHGSGLAGNDRVLWANGCDVVGPLLVGFVQWCLGEAERLGLPKLYFISRDGQILHRIARILQARWSSPVALHYLYGSRQAWNAAGWSGDLQEALAWAFVPTQDLGLGEVFERLHLDAGHFQEALENNGFPRATWGRPLAADDLARARALFESGLFTQAAIAASQQARKLAVSYLEQEGLLDGGPVGIVDIGWRGSLQRNLQRLLRSYNGCTETRLHGFYFGLVSKPTELDPANLHSYWGACSPPSEALSKQNLGIFEAFTAGTHGGVLGYQRTDGGSVKPALAPVRQSTDDGWSVELLQRAVLQFATEYVKRLRNGELSHGEMFSIWLGCFREFYDNPSMPEAECWSRMALSEGQVERSYLRLVDTRSLLQLFLSLAPWSTRPRYWWRTASFARHGGKAMWLYQCFLRAQCLRTRLRTMLKSKALSL